MGLYTDVLTKFAKSRVGGWTIMNVFTPLDKRLMRWSKGRINTGIGSAFRDRAVLLVSRGAKSGKRRETPLVCTPFGDRYVLIASAAGAAKNPAWYYNLKANPECSLLQASGDETLCVAHEAEGAERDEAWAAANNLYEGYDDYQGRTDRTIPVMVLTPQ